MIISLCTCGKASLQASLVNRAVIYQKLPFWGFKCIFKGDDLNLLFFLFCVMKCMTGRQPTTSTHVYKSFNVLNLLVIDIDYNYLKGIDGQGGRDGVLDSNREGVISSLGYFILYIFGVVVGKVIFGKER